MQSQHHTLQLYIALRAPHAVPIRGRGALRHSSRQPKRALGGQPGQHWPARAGRARRVACSGVRGRLGLPLIAQHAQHESRQLAVQRPCPAPYGRGCYRLECRLQIWSLGVSARIGTLLYASCPPLFLPPIGQQSYPCKVRELHNQSGHHILGSLSPGPSHNTPHHLGGCSREGATAACLSIGCSCGAVRQCTACALPSARVPTG